MKCNWLLAIFAIFTLLLFIFIEACAKPAEFELTALDVTPQVALSGDTINVAAEVKNIGQREGSYSAVVNINGVTAGTQTITLLPEASQRLVFSLTEDKAGSYQVSVGELSASFKIKEPTLEQLKIDYPELYQELLKLPELAEIDEKDNEAIRQIAYLALQPENKAAFESILNEGIKDKRKYCTPLEGLLWIAYDSKFDKYNPLADYSTTKLINYAWKLTTTSNIYYSERWANFDEVVDRLNSPILARIYLHDNVLYYYAGPQSQGVKSAEQVFKDKEGACYDYAVLAGYCLKKNGYDNTQGMRMSFDRVLQRTPNGDITGHIVCLCQDPKDSLYYVVDNQGGYMIYGPYQSVDDAVKSTSERTLSGKGNLTLYSLHQIDLKTGKYETTWTFY